MGSRDLNTTAAAVIEMHTPSGYEGNVECWCGERFPKWYAHAEHVAAAVLAALSLREEWQVCTDGTYFGRHLTLAEAESELARRKAIEAAEPEPTDWELNPRIEHRVVTPWVAASRVGEQP